MGAPQHEVAKYDGDHNTFFQTRFFKPGLSLYDLGMKRLQAFKYEHQPNGLRCGSMPRLSAVGIAVR
jgi:hypothetical protein